LGRVKNVFTNLGLLVVALMISFVLIEAGLRIFNPIEMRLRGDQIHLPFFKHYEIKVNSGGKLDPIITHTRNSLGFRGKGLPKDWSARLSILAIGGSTTENFFITDGKTWPELLGGHLQDSFKGVWINNTGLLGHSTFGHIHLMRQYVIGLRPKAALFLIGINDKARTGTTSIEESMREVRPGIVRKVRSFLFANSELISLLWNVHRSLKATQAEVTNKEILDFTSLGTQETNPEKEAKILEYHRAFLGSYRLRVRELVSLSKDNGIVPVLITQPAVFGFGIDGATGIDLGKIRALSSNGASSWKELELYNDVTREIAAETGVFLVDLGRKLKKTSRYYYDTIHFSNAGAAAAARIIFEELCPYLQKTFPDDSSGSCF
jgi:lysophospholipase L1-like esterase